MPTIVHRVATAAALTAVTAAVFGSAPAHADAAINNYINYLHDQGIGFNGSDARMIEAGLDICDAISAGRSPISLAKRIYLESDGVSSTETSVTIVVASVLMLCPEYTPMLPGSAGSSVL